MEINISNLKINLTELRKKVNQYDDNYINIYHHLIQSSSYWNDKYSNRFFSCVEEKRHKIDKNIQELNKMINVYQYIIDQYQSLGSKVKIKVENRNDVISAIDHYIQQLNNIISYYQGLDVSFCPNEAYFLNQEKQKLIKMRDSSINMKQNIKNIFNLVEETERTVKSKNNKIHIEILKDINIGEYI